MEFSFATKKLKSLITRITFKAKNLDINLDDITVFGVSKEEGVVVTGKDIGKNLGSYFYFEGQKFVYNPYRVNIGSIGLTPVDFKGLISPAYVIFEVNETVYPEFLLLYLKSNVGIRSIKWYGDRGGVRSSLKFSDLSKIDFPDITYDQQKLFYEGYLIKSEKIKMALVEYDKQQQYILKLRQSILQDAIQGNLTKIWREETSNTDSASQILSKIKEKKEQLIKEKKIKKENHISRIIKDEINFNIPENWELCKMGDVSDIQRGSSPRPKGDPRYFSNIKTNNNWISIKDISKYSKNNVLHNTDEYLTDLGTKYSRYVKKDELIVAVSGSTTGKSCLTGIEGYIYDGLAVIRLVDDNIIPNYLLLYMLQLYSHMNDSKFGAAFPNINTQFLKEMLFQLPPLNEQKVIVEKVNQLFSNCDTLEKEIIIGKENSERLLQSILSELLGEDYDNILTYKKPVDKLQEVSSREIKYNSKTLFMDLIKILKENGKLHAEDLWKMSRYPDDIDAFYAELKKQIEVEKTIKEVLNEKGYLELV